MSSSDSTEMTVWPGGTNPAPGLFVDVVLRDGDDSLHARNSSHLDWFHYGRASDIVKFRVAGAKEAHQDAPASSSAASFSAYEALQTGTVEFPPIDASMIADRVTIDGTDVKDWVSCPGGGMIGLDVADGPDRTIMSVEIPPGYDKLFAVLIQAFDQAAGGKGKERHARAGVAFQDQPMALINKQIGSIDGFIYQAHKKSLESLRLPDGRAQAELLGAINYLAGAVIALDTWANKSSSKS